MVRYHHSQIQQFHTTSILIQDRHISSQNHLYHYIERATQSYKHSNMSVVLTMQIVHALFPSLRNTSTKSLSRSNSDSDGVIPEIRVEPAENLEMLPLLCELGRKPADGHRRSSSSSSNISVKRSLEGPYLCHMLDLRRLSVETTTRQWKAKEKLSHSVVSGMICIDPRCDSRISRWGGSVVYIIKK